MAKKLSGLFFLRTRFQSLMLHDTAVKLENGTLIAFEFELFQIHLNVMFYFKGQH